NGLTKYGVPLSAATQIAHLPPTAALFGAFLGYNPVAQLLSPQILASIGATNRDTLLGKEFFPHLIATPFMEGLHVAFYVSAALCLIGATVSFLRGPRVVNVTTSAAQPESVSEPAAAQ